MKWIEVKVIFDFDNKQLATDLISNLFYDFGLKGVVVEDPDDEPAEGWGDGAERKPDHYAVTGYFAKTEQAEKNCKVLEDKLKRLYKENGIIFRIVCQEIDEQDWAESWKAYFWPEKITKNVVVKPTWRDYDAHPDEIVLEIDPGMAFGTGTHPTTSLCLNMIETYLKKGDSFLDIGTGSGILMIAAAKLGAKKVWGVDIDEVAVNIARKNLLLNNIGSKRFNIKTGNLVDVIEDRFDIVAANILSDVILVLLDSIKNVLAQDGIFICSGIVEENKAMVAEKMEAVGFELIGTLTKESWVSIAGKLKK